MKNLLSHNPVPATTTDVQGQNLGLFEIDRRDKSEIFHKRTKSI
jgi:hypothetical protein